uniref:Uncharacterized protein n=1 Tax=Arcella intermedia TaxID=1963864 RepID=A0A6B2LBY8_9EUKA
MLEVKHRLDNAHDCEIWALAHKGDRIATGSVDGKVKIWTADLELKHEIVVSPLAILSMDIKGNQLLTSCMDSHIRIYDMNHGQLISDIDTGSVNAWQARFQPKTNNVGSTGHSGHVNIYDVDTGKLVNTFKPNNPTFSTALAFNNSGNLVACCSKDGSVTLFDSNSTEKQFEAHLMAIRSASFSPDSAFLLTGGDDKHINLFDTQTGTKVNSVSGHSSAVLCISVAPSGKHFATSGGDQKVKIWAYTDKGSTECVATLSHHTGQVWGVAWGSNSDRLVSVGDDASIIVYKCL